MGGIRFLPIFFADNSIYVCFAPPSETRLNSQGSDEFSYFGVIVYIINSQVTYHQTEALFLYAGVARDDIQSQALDDISSLAALLLA